MSSSGLLSSRANTPVLCCIASAQHRGLLVFTGVWTERGSVKCKIKIIIGNRNNFYTLIRQVSADETGLNPVKELCYSGPGQNIFK